MKFYINEEFELFDDKIVSIEKWYDKHTKLWVVYCKNKDGCQVGNAFYAPKKSATLEYDKLKKEYDIIGD